MLSKFKDLLILAAATRTEASLSSLFMETKLSEEVKRKKFDGFFAKLKGYSKDLAVDVKRTMLPRLVAESVQKWTS